MESAKNYSDGHYKLTQILHIQHDDFFYLSPTPQYSRMIKSISISPFIDYYLEEKNHTKLAPGFHPHEQ